MRPSAGTVLLRSFSFRPRVDFLVKVHGCAMYFHFPRSLFVEYVFSCSGCGDPRHASPLFSFPIESEKRVVTSHNFTFKSLLYNDRDF